MIRKKRASPHGLAILFLGLRLLWGCAGLGFAEVGVDDLELEWGEELAGAGIAGGLEGGHEGLVRVDFTGEEFARSGFAAVGEIGRSKILFEYKT